MVTVGRHPGWQPYALNGNDYKVSHLRIQHTVNAISEVQT